MTMILRAILFTAALGLLCSCDSKKTAETPQPEKPREPVKGTITARPLPQRSSSESKTLFELLPADRTGISFGLNWENPADNLKEFLFLNPSGGICTGDYDGDGLPDIYVTSPKGGNRLYRNLGDFKFEETTESAGVSDENFWGTGASFVDIDNDGDLDLYACGYLSPNKLFINDGSGKFTDRADDVGLAFNGGSMMMSFADIDNDGDLDGYLATTAVEPPEGTKFRVKFIPRESDGVEVPTILPELQEYWEILYLPGDKVRKVEAGQFDHLFRNDNGKFVDVSKEAGIEGAYFTLSATWFDYDIDGDPDLYVSNDYTGPDYLYRNRGDGTFENVILDAVPHTPWFSMGSDVGDLNNDGLPDLMTSDMSATSHYREKVMMGNMDDSGWFLEWAEPRQYMRNALFINSGTGRFYEAAFMAGLSSSDWTWSPRIEDFDQDGFADLFITNGVMRDNMNSDLTSYAEANLKPGTPEYNKFWLEKPMRKENNLAFRNHGDLKFSSIGEDWGLERHGVSFGTATADFDADGDPDLVVSNADGPVSVYRNNSATNNRVAIQLVGVASNHQGHGATIRLTSSSGTQTRTITSARGWLSASDTTVLFGLGDSDKIKQLEILWPGGTRQVFQDLEADQHYTISEPVGQEYPPSPPSKSPLFTQSDHLQDAKHQEIPFDDFKLQPLLPNKLSQLGPGMAWGDIDGDGDDDFFLGGANGQAGQFFLNSGEGRFSPHPSVAFNATSQSEDLGALFFDCDNDGDLDLYVAHGSVEHQPDHEVYRDSLYLNDGKGSFSPAPKDSLPNLTFSSSALAAADIDHDGDIDLFIGGRVIPGQYPLAPKSQLLINNGGKFTNIPLPDLGMVTGALFSDANNDGWIDLFVTSEWGPVHYLENSQGKLADKTDEAGLSELLGWWNGISGGDIDGDGDIDYLITNFGLNTKYKASPKKPEMIYYGDFDGSGRSHLIEAKLVEGKLLPRRGFSCSKSAMPFLQSKVGTFHNFASSGLSDLYSETRLKNSLKLEANTLENGLLLNDGNGRFTWKALPRFAQIAPSFGSSLTDLDGDGDLDAVLAQNFFSPQRETGRMDGGLSLILDNDGQGNLTPLGPKESGLEISGDSKSLTISDLNGDGRPDLILGINDSSVVSFLNQETAKQLTIKLPENSFGTKIVINGILREASSGGSYLSQSSPTLFFPAPSSQTRATIIWPDGTQGEEVISPDQSHVLLKKPEK